ncbi:MAG: alpha/beta hydrolase [Planctomycetota bacterium]|nr:MAG: alpha/beta hydrolase [Planctomycetota bacterium]
MPLDPQAQVFLDKFAASQAPPMHTLSPPDARALVVPLQMPKETMGRLDNRTIPGPAGEIPVRIYHPRSENEPAAEASPRPIVVYFHGGGWVVGSIASHDAICRRLCNLSGCIFISVGYRLAPEHKFPAAVDDCYTATAWATINAPELGGDPDRIAVCGDSAGGNLAAVVALLARDRGGPPLAHQSLIYPITDYMPEFDSYRRNGADYFLTTGSIQWFWDHYLNDPSQADDPAAAPIRAEDLSGLPPATILVAEFDPLYDEGLAYADRLEQAGVPVERIICNGQIHGFLRRLDTFDSAVEVAQQLAHSLQTALRAPPPSECGDPSPL